MDSEFITIKMGPNMKEIGSTISKMEMDQKHGMMGLNTWENIKMGKRKGMGYLNG